MAIPTATDVRTRSTLGGDVQAMSIDTSAIAHLMSVLTNLYANPIAAVIREYSTNAYDATVEAGSAEPVLVTLPTALRPWFSVQDYGIGMTTDTILSHYSLYGRSDKRDSNTAVGMLGLGCKSALTYADQFTIVSVRNGVQTTAVVSKNDQGVGQIEIADTCSTTERNGTLITIPVKSYDIRRFVDEASEIYSYWQRGSVLVNGQAPENAYVGMTQAPNTEFYYKANSWGEGHFVVMGNVAYKVNSDLLNDFRAMKVVINANIGDVSFAPSREELMYDNRTNKFLRDSVNAARENVKQHIDTIMASAATKPEALALFSANSGLSLLNNVKWTFNGESIPGVLRGNDCLSYQITAWSSKARRGCYVVAGNANSTRFVFGYKNKSISSTIKYTIKKWAEDQNSDWYGANDIVFYDAKPDWADWVEWIDYDDIKDEFATAKASSPSYRSQPRSRSGRVIDVNGDVTPDYAKAEETPDATFVVFSLDDKNNDIYFRKNVQKVRAVGWKPVLVYVREQETFLDTFTVKTMADVNTEYATRLAAVPDGDYLAEVIRHKSVVETLRKKADKVMDDDLRAVLQYKQVESNREFLSDDKRMDKARSAWRVFVKQYPFLDRYTENGYDYLELVNALYTYRKDQ